MQQTIISMPESYWELSAGFWKIKKEWLAMAKKREDKIIAKKGDTLLVIGDLSNHPKK
jgi:hypothetical protein